MRNMGSLLTHSHRRSVSSFTVPRWRRQRCKHLVLYLWSGHIVSPKTRWDPIARVRARSMACGAGHPNPRSRKTSNPSVGCSLCPGCLQNSIVGNDPPWLDCNISSAIKGQSGTPLTGSPSVVILSTKMGGSYMLPL